MKIRILGCLVVVCVLYAQASLAAELPQFDTDAYCENVAELGGGSNVLKKQCLQDEKGAIRRLGKMDEVPAKTWKYCAKMAKMADGSYVLMEQCINDEMDAAE